MPQQLDDLSRSLTPLEQDSTIIAVIEMSQASWLVAGIVPGLERHPLKKLEPSEVELRPKPLDIRCPIQGPVDVQREAMIAAARWMVAV